MIVDGWCPCCGRRDAVGSGGCARCASRTTCGCGALLACGCGTQNRHDSCPNVVPSNVTFVLPNVWSGGGAG